MNKCTVGIQSMEKIINFKLNQNTDSCKNILRVLDIITIYKKFRNKRVVGVSTITNLPQEVIEMKFQQLIFKNSIIQDLNLNLIYPSTYSNV